MYLKKCYISVTTFLTSDSVCVRMKYIKYESLTGVNTVDKHEYRQKTERMLKCLENKSYKEAYDIAESIDWNKVKNVAVLCAVSEIYEYNGEYQKSREILFMAYDRQSDSKKIIYRLGMLALKMNELEEAKDCYEEFLELAPNDSNRFIFQYKILKSQNALLKEQIAVLEEFKKAEYVEKWAYELAELYRQAGMIKECLEECDDLILWFSEGKYIYKAMELKMEYKPLTPLQQEKYMSRFETVKEPKVEETPEVEENTEVEEEKQSMSIEEIVQDWQEQQKENAQMIQAELERVEAEKAQSEETSEEEEKEEILSDDVRKLMEELEAESAEIDAQKISKDIDEIVEDKPLLQKVVEQLSAIDMGASHTETTEMEEIVAKELAEMGDLTSTEPEAEDEGIKLGNTQEIALSAKALASAARVEVPDETPLVETVIPETSVPNPIMEEAGMAGNSYDTGFVVQGRYDLEAHSEIGLKAGLTEEQKKLFSYFVPVHGMSEQIVKVLHDDKCCKSRYGTSRIGNVVIVGRKGSGKTVLAVNIVKAIQKARKMKQGKVAIVNASALNKKRASEIVEKLHGGALVIESASKLNRNTVEELCELMEGQTGELLVVMEDERKAVEKLFAAYPNFAKKFTSKIELPVFINDELVTFGQTYAKENGYKIDEMGILALYSDIDILQREEKAVTVADVKAIIDDAIENANRLTVKKLIKKLFGKNKDEADRIILKEEDFR